MSRTPRRNVVEHRMALALDQLAAFDEFKSNILPLLKQALEKGWTAEEIQADPKIRAMMVARQVSIGLTDDDAARALAAIRDLRDRDEGKAVERRIVKATIENLTDAELDAKLARMMADNNATDDLQ